MILLKNPKNASTKLSTNGKFLVISTAPPFVLRLSKDERRVFQQNRKSDMIPDPFSKSFKTFALQRFEQLELFERFEQLHRWHRALYTGLLKLVFVVLANIGIFVGVFDQRAALLDFDINSVFAAFVGDLKADRMDAAAVAQRQVARH